MSIPVLARLALTGAVLLTLSACQDDPVDPTDDLTLASARGEPGPGGPGGGGGGGGGGGAPPTTGDLYSDLVYILRDVNGLPMLKKLPAEEGTVLCVQPVSYTELPVLGDLDASDIVTMTNPVNEKDVWLIPLYGDIVPYVPVPEGAITTAAQGGKPDKGGEDEETTELAPCDPYGEFNADGTVVFTYGDYTSEVPFGRLNMGRAPQRTVDRAYSEVELKLTTAAGNVWLDHAGRWAPSDVAIDAPAENLVIHREMITKGAFGSFASPTPAGLVGWNYDAFGHAASTLAGAADKFGSIPVDLVVYNNRILDLPNLAAANGRATITGGVDDGTWTHGFPGEKYVSYVGFTYNRARTFPGCVAYTIYDPSGNPVLQTKRLVEAVFGGNGEVTATNINGFAQWAEDARAVILFEHDTFIREIDRIGENGRCSGMGF